MPPSPSWARSFLREETASAKWSAHSFILHTRWSAIPAAVLPHDSDSDVCKSYQCLEDLKLNGKLWYAFLRFQIHTLWFTWPYSITRKRTNNCFFTNNAIFFKSWPMIAFKLKEKKYIPSSFSSSHATGTGGLLFFHKFSMDSKYLTSSLKNLVKSLTAS